MNWKTVGLGLCGVIVWAGLSGCMVGPDYKEPEVRVQGKWRKFEGGSDRAPTGAEVYWWRSLWDSTLNQLVETAFRNNPDLQAAGVRILSARAELNKTVGNLFPQRQELSLGAGRYGVDDSAGDSSFLGGGNAIFASQALVSATWEIDFWGKYRRKIQSDRARFLASIAAYDSALVSLIADVATTYVNIRTGQARLGVARENLALQRKSARMAEARLKAGQTQGMDLAMAETRVAATEALIPALEEGIDKSMNALAILVGEPPESIRRRLGGGGSPRAPGSVALGMPKDLLRRRPDVRAAGLMAASQSARIGVEFAKLLPSFSLTGSFGYGTGDSQYASASNIFNWQQGVADAAGSLVVPILNYGRIVNEVRVQDAVFQESVLVYQKVVLQAQREVEDAISGYVQSRRRVDRYQSAAGSAGRALEMARLQYEAGTTNFTTVVTAEESKLANEEGLAVARGEVLLSLIGIYRALGGGWELRGDGGDILSPEVRRQMADRTNWGKMLEPSGFLPRSLRSDSDSADAATADAEGN